MSGILMASVGNSYGSAPVNTVAPVVSGTATVGETLSTTNGTWLGAPAPTFTYQWQRTGSNIGGATSSTYVLVAADYANTIRCVVTATNSSAPSGVSANSNSTASVAGNAPVNTVAPVVSGTAQARQTLSSTTGTWTGVPTPTFTYQWQFGTSNIGGATSSTYVVSSTYVGQTIRCVVTATNAVSAVSANSNATSAIAANVPTAPTIGTATATSSSAATVAFTASSDDGGAAISSYTATSSPGGLTGTGSSPITVSGLSPSTSYTFTVYATNSVGNSASSSSSNSITTSAPNWFTQLAAIGQNVQGVSGAPMLLSNGNLLYAGTGSTGALNTFASYNSSGTQVFSKKLYANACLGSLSVSTPSYVSSSDRIYYALNEGGVGSGSLGVGALASVSSSSITGAFTARTAISKQSGSNVTGVYMPDNAPSAADSSGNLYVGVGAYRNINTCCDTFQFYAMGLAKVNSSGTPQWFKYIPVDSPEATSDQGFATSVAISGSDIILAGGQYVPNAGEYGFLIYKYNSSGSLTASKYYYGNASSGQFTVRVAVDGSGNIYVLSRQLNNTAAGGLQVTKLDSSLNVQWATTISSSDSNGVFPGDITVGVDGNIYFAGQWSLATQGYRQTITIFKINTSGTLQWSRYVYGSNSGAVNSGEASISFFSNKQLTTSSSSLYVVAGYKPNNSGSNVSAITMKLPLDGSGTATGITFPSPADSSTFNVNYQELTVTTGSNTPSVTTLGVTPQTAVLDTTTTSTPTLVDTGFTLAKTNI